MRVTDRRVHFGGYAGLRLRGWALSCAPRLLRVAVAVLLPAMLLAAGCAEKEDSEALFARMISLGEQDRWPEVRPVMKAYLQRHPNDASAHLLLGQCYQWPPTLYLTVAEGEFRTALNLYHRNSDMGGLEDILTPSEFESIIHQETARVQMKWSLYFKQIDQLPNAAAVEPLRRALIHVRKGLELEPGSRTLQEMERSLVREVGEELPVRSARLPHSGAAQG